MTGLGFLDERLLALFDGGEKVLVAALVAAAAGAVHAAAPGHGKTLAVATLVGPRGRPVHAVALGVSVAGMHTASVGMLALAWYALVDGVGGGLGATTAALQLVAAGAASLVAVAMLRHHLGGRRAHHHAHGGGDAPPWSRRGLIAVAMSGGLVPSPSAFLVLVTGLLSGRAWMALILVGAFASGLALTLTIVGLLAVTGRDVLSTAAARVPGLSTLITGLPVVAAVGVLVGALLLGGSALGDLMG